jgi:hypothetical protein
MGACLVGRSYPGKTLAQAQKLWDKDCEQSRHEDGHSYSGAIGMLNSGRVTSHVFNTYEEFEEFLSDKRKDDAYWAQVKVIRETKPLLMAREKSRIAANNLWNAKREKKAPSVIKTLTARRDKATEKVRAIEAAQAAKSTKTVWCVGGMASS